MNTRLCAKTDKHKGRPIQAFCLEEDCKKNRLLCFYCIFQSHKNHQIAYLHKELDGPLSRLTNHTDENIDCKDHFQNTFAKMLKYCDKLSKVMSSKVSSFRHHMQPQFEAIRKTFKKSSADDIIKDLTSNHNISEERQERYVKMLRFYINKNFYDFTILQKNVNAMNKKYDKLFATATEKIEMILKELLDEVLQFDLLNDKPEKRLEKIVGEFQEDINERKLDQQTKIQKNKIEGAQIEEEERMQEEKQMPINEAQPQYEQNQDNNEQFNSNNKLFLEKIAQDQGPSFSQMLNYSDPIYSQRIPEEIILQKIKGTDGGKMIFKKKNRGFEHDQGNQEQDLKDNWDPPHKNFTLPTEPNKREIRTQYLKENEVQIINIYAPNTNEINKLLAKIKPQSVKELSIFCNSQLCALDKESGRLISQFYSLKTLRILWARGLSDDLVIYMIRHFPLLQNLCLAEFDNVSHKLAQAIKANCINLKTLFFTFDISQNLYEMESSLQFLPDIVNYKVPERFLEDLTMGLPDLQNIELCGVRNISYWVFYITESKDNIKQFSLFKYENQNKIDYTPLMQALSQCTHLEAIKLQLVEFEERNLIALIKNNPNLKSIVINECSMTKALFETISRYCPNLKHLVISLEEVFTGQSLCNLKNLQTLVIRGCLSIKPVILSHNLNKLKKLRCISFNFNSVDNNWVTEKVLKVLGSMNRVTCLNLNHCKITGEEISHITNLTHLTSLVCDTNNFSYDSILNLKSNLTLRKLGIGKNMLNQTAPQEQINLELIHHKFPLLTHLKLCSFKNIEVGKVSLFKKLVSLSIYDGIDKEIQELSHYCREKNIKLITDRKLKE